MKILFAPMEGIAHHLYRSAQAAVFENADEYFIPFISPRNSSFSHRERSDVLPENNAGMHAVPQLLSNDSQSFLWAAGELEKLGYAEVNLNLGCPSATVVRKGKGAGMLAYPEKLDRFLAQIFQRCPLQISIKTRLGMRAPEEFPPLLEIFNRYPVKRLIVHPRLGTDGYRGTVRLESFRWAMENSRAPLCYNGDLFTPQNLKDFQQQFPSVESVMCARGFLYHPGLAGLFRGTGDEAPQRLEKFHRMLYEGYRQEIGTEAFVLCKMKEVWAALGQGQELSPKAMKRLRKAEAYGAYETAVEAAFAELKERL